MCVFSLSIKILKNVVKKYQDKTHVRGSNQKGKQSCYAEPSLIYQGLGECEGQKTEPL